MPSTWWLKLHWEPCPTSYFLVCCFIQSVSERSLSYSSTSVFALCWTDKMRVQTGKFHILQFLIEVIKDHTKHCNVATASAGLLTNLAHSNEIASRLTELDGICLIVKIMGQHSHDTHLQRNCCAALSNLSSSSGYFCQLVECLGVERLFASLNLSAIHPNRYDSTLLCIRFDSESLCFFGFQSNRATRRAGAFYYRHRLDNNQNEFDSYCLSKRVAILSFQNHFKDEGTNRR